MNRRFVLSATLLLAAAGLGTNAQEKNLATEAVSPIAVGVSKIETDKKAAPGPQSRLVEGQPCVSINEKCPPAVDRTISAERKPPPRAETKPKQRPDDPDKTTPTDGTGFRWTEAIKQSLFFLGVQHGYALSQPKTRRSLRGSFINDYKRSLRGLHGWADGGRFFTNYVAHPLQGAFLGFLQVQNDPPGKGLPISGEKAYWKSRLKAMAWAAAWSTQFEIGPVSQASIGNVGMYGKQTYVDIVMTPTAGVGFLIIEDALDRYVIRKIELRSKNYFVKIFTRMLFNPTRTMANILRLKTPWFRDKGLR